MNKTKPEWPEPDFTLPYKNKIGGELLAEQHVDWLLKLLRPLLIEEFVHGYKHGREE